MKSSALAFLASKRGEILPSAFEQEAAKLKESIEGGLVTGISFPKKKVRVCDKQRKRTDDDRRALAEKVNQLTRSGYSARQLLIDEGINSRIYRNWCKSLGIEVAEKKRSDIHDLEILRLVQGGDSRDQACAKFGVNTPAWRARMIKKGYITPNDRQKPKSHYAEKVAKVRALVADKDITITAACEEIGFPLPDWNRYKYLA